MSEVISLFSLCSVLCVQFHMDTCPCRFLTRWQRSSSFDLQLNTNGACIDSATERFVLGQFYSSISLDLTNTENSSGLRTKKRCHSKIIKVHPALSTFFIQVLCKTSLCSASNQSPSELMATHQHPTTLRADTLRVYKTIRIHLVCSHKTEVLNLIHKL